jgi:hypothetical protein
MLVENLESLHASLTESSWRRLNSFLHSVEKGQPINYVTPFLPKEWRDDELGYGALLLKKFGSTGVPLMDEIEAKESEKFGPTSIRAPWEVRKDGVREYFTQKSVSNDANLQRSFDTLAKAVKPHSLRPLSVRAAYLASPKGKNLGLPVFTADKEFEKEYLRRVERIAAGGWKEKIFPAVVGWRGQPNGSTTLIKNRVVWMVDHAETYAGTGIIQVLLNALRDKPGFAAWNELSVVDRRITSIIDRSKFPIMSVDFSGFDKSLPRIVIELAFSLMEYWFDGSARSQINWLRDQFLNMPIVTPDGILSGRDGGVPSGDSGTNMIDSLGQILMAYAASYDLEYELCDIEVLGDDGVYSFNNTVNVDALSSYYMERFGMEVSSDKGGYSADNVLFLQRLHARNYRRHGLTVGMRSIIRTLNGICHLERLNSNLPPEFFSARAIMSAENARWHPLFPLLVKHLYESDRYMSQMDPAEIFVRAGGTEFVEEVLGLRSYRFTSELPTRGLDTFATVIELRRLRGRQGKVTRPA